MLDRLRRLGQNDFMTAEMKNRKNSTEEQIYKNINENARFREQFRFAFSSVVIATFYVAPFGDPISTYLKLVLGFASIFSAFYIIATASAIKYQNARELYVVFHIGERLRRRAYDFSVDFFAFGLLLFISIVALGGLQTVFNFHLSSWPTVILTTIITIILAIVFLLVGKWLQRIDLKHLRDSDGLI